MKKYKKETIVLQSNLLEKKYLKNNKDKYLKATQIKNYKKPGCTLLAILREKMRLVGYRRQLRTITSAHQKIVQFIETSANFKQPTSFSLMTNTMGWMEGLV